MAKNELAELQAQLAAMQAENERLRQERAQAGKVSLKVSEKGAVSVYGMGRFPITLYREQWEKLLAHKGQIETFIRENARMLSSKEDKREAPAAKTEGGTRVDMSSGKVAVDDVPLVA